MSKYGDSWVEGKEMAIARKLRQEKDKRLEISKKKIQTKIDFGEKKLSEAGKKEWEKVKESEKRKERLELQEMKENLWKWRQGGKETTCKGKERRREITVTEMEEKFNKLEKILEKERNEIVAQEKKVQASQMEKEKKKLRLERQRKAEEKWKIMRWVTKFLEENEEEFLEAIDIEKECEKKEEKEYEAWNKMKRMEKIDNIRSEGRWAEKKARKDLEEKLLGKKIPPNKCDKKGL